MFNIYSELIEDKKVQVANENDSIEDLLAKMEFNTLPVLNDENKYLGIISKVNIYEKMFKEKIDIKGKIVRDFMLQHEPITKKDTLDEVLIKLSNNRYLFLSVINEEGKFIGIVTNTTMRKLFSNIIAVERKDSISLVTMDGIGTLNRVTKILKKYRVNIVSISTIDTEVMRLKYIYIKVTCDEKYPLDFVKRKLAENGFNDIA